MIISGDWEPDELTVSDSSGARHFYQVEKMPFISIVKLIKSIPCPKCRFYRISLYISYFLVKQM